MLLRNYTRSFSISSAFSLVPYHFRLLSLRVLQARGQFSLIHTAFLSHSPFLAHAAQAFGQTKKLSTVLNEPFLQSVSHVVCLHAWWSVDHYNTFAPPSHTCGFLRNFADGSQICAITDFATFFTVLLHPRRIVCAFSRVCPLTALWMIIETSLTGFATFPAVLLHPYRIFNAFTRVGPLTAL